MKLVKQTAYLAFVLTISAAQSSMLEQWNTKKLTTESDAVRVGEVTSKWSSWDAEKKMIFTYVKLKVSETVKGKSQEEVLIKQPGGELGGVGMKVHGMAVFEQGEKALVFLKQNDGDYPALVGMAQGKFRITKDKASGEDKARFSAPADAEYYSMEQNGERRHISAATMNKEMSLNRLIQEIKDVR